MKLKGFFAELRRRNVYKVAAGYAVIAWLLIQIATQVFPFFGVPSWLIRLFVLVVVLGFPIALVIAWAFEMTPEGMKRTENIPPDVRLPQWTRRKFALFLTITAAIAASLWLFQLLRPRSQQLSRAGLPSAQRVAAIPQKSIAVLPFANLSSEKENAYFAEGIQDEILNRLSKIADLKVISRTSTEHYKTAPENLRDIGRELGVANILEGSVQKNGQSVRVNVQLIKAANDSHLWGDVYDRKLTDLFSVESEVAKAIAEQLQARLTGAEKEVIAARPTNNPDAYDAYLRGLAYTVKTGGITPSKSLGAQKHLREAVRLDPKFALAWALLSYVDAIGYITQSLQPTAALREETRVAAETALTLKPDLGEALVAKGYYYYGCLKDYESAARYFERARQFLPNNSRIPESLAYVMRRRGQWQKSESYFNQAEQLDPRNANLLTQHVLSYLLLGRFPEAMRKLDQVLDITPDDQDTIALKAAVFQAQGNLAEASSLLAPLRAPADQPFIIETQAYQAILERRPETVIRQLKEILARPDPSLGYFNGELRFWLGWAQQVAGETNAAKQSWQQARSELEQFLKTQPQNFALLDDLALTNMGLGDEAAAFAFAERASRANPTEQDAMYGPFSIEITARIAAWAGDPERALASLERLVSVPYRGPLVWVRPLTPALLRLDPIFDPIRADPRFQKMIARFAGPRISP